MSNGASLDSNAPRWERVPIGHTKTGAKKGVPGDEITIWCREGKADYQITFVLPPLPKDQT